VRNIGPFALQKGAQVRVAVPGPNRASGQGSSLQATVTSDLDVTPVKSDYLMARTAEQFRFRGNDLIFSAGMLIETVGQ
jgi:hypothetical protein